MAFVGGGFRIIVVGQGATALLAPHLSWVGVLGASILSFGGVGLVLSPSQAAGLSTLSKPEYPHGVALLNTFIQVAAAVGPSLLIGILSSHAASLELEGIGAVQANADGLALAISVATVIALAGAVVATLYSRMLASSEISKDKSEGTPGNAPTDTATNVPAEPSIASLMGTQVFSVPVTATIADVVSQFVSTKTSGLPVTDGDGRVCGYSTDGDILRAVAPQPDSAIDLAFGLNIYLQDKDTTGRVAEVMQLGVLDLASRHVVTANLDDSVEDVAVLPSSRPISKVPVLSGDVIVGVITRGDLVRSIFGSFIARQADPA